MIPSNPGMQNNTFICFLTLRKQTKRPTKSAPQLAARAMYNLKGNEPFTTKEYSSASKYLLFSQICLTLPTTSSDSARSRKYVVASEQNVSCFTRSPKRATAVFDAYLLSILSTLARILSMSAASRTFFDSSKVDLQASISHLSFGGFSLSQPCNTRAAISALVQPMYIIRLAKDSRTRKFVKNSMSAAKAAIAAIGSISAYAVLSEDRKSRINSLVDSCTQFSQALLLNSTVPLGSKIFDCVSRYPTKYSRFKELLVPKEVEKESAIKSALHTIFDKSELFLIRSSAYRELWREHPRVLTAMTRVIDLEILSPPRKSPDGWQPVVPTNKCFPHLAHSTLPTDVSLTALSPQDQLYLLAVSAITDKHATVMTGSVSNALALLNLLESSSFLRSATQDLRNGRLFDRRTGLNFQVEGRLVEDFLWHGNNDAGRAIELQRDVRIWAKDGARGVGTGDEGLETSPRAEGEEPRGLWRTLLPDLEILITEDPPSVEDEKLQAAGIKIIRPFQFDDKKKIVRIKKSNEWVNVPW